MAARLTARQKGEILVDFVESGSYRATAKKYGVSDKTVKRICDEDSAMSQKVAQKKEKDIANMMEYMESRKKQAQAVLDNCLNALSDSKKIDAAKLSEIATVMGIVIDKFINNPIKNQLDQKKFELELM